MPVSPSLARASAPLASADWGLLGPDLVEHSPRRLVQAIGSRVWSQDGAEYIDFDNGGGAVLLGHRDPAVSVLDLSPIKGVDSRVPRSLWMNECLGHHLFTLGAVNMTYAHGERKIAALLAAFDQAVDRLALALRQAILPTRRSAAQSYG